MKGAEAVRAFAVALLTGDGHFECGETWTLQDGWRAYARTGCAMLTLPPRAMRKLGELYRDTPGAPDEVRRLGETMIECSNAAKAKNERREVPDGALAITPHAGKG
jgi:hypothetical protein